MMPFRRISHHFFRTSVFKAMSRRRQNPPPRRVLREKTTKLSKRETPRPHPQILKKKEAKSLRYCVNFHSGAHCPSILTVQIPPLHPQVTPEQKKKKTEAEVEAEIAEKNEKMAKKNQDTAKKHYNATDKTEAKMLKKEEKCKCHHPDHHDIASFLAYDKTYHTPEHRKGKDIPIECFCCEVKFTTGPPGAGLYKVAREGNLVYACKDAMDGELDTCIKAFCKPCYSKMLDKLPTGRSRKRTSAVMYGERMDANGNVTAS